MSQAASAAPPLAPLTGSARVLGTLALSAATFMNVLDTSIANVSLPAIAGDLGVSPNQGTWVITSFAVANAIAVPLTGWLSQRFGQVRLFTLSVLLFVLTSWMCGLAPNMAVLIGFRALQGFVAGPLIPLSQGLLLSSYPRAMAGLAMAMWSMTTLVAPATVIGIGLGFGAQQMVGDLLAGFFLFAERQFAFGDVIRLSMPGQTSGVQGTVEELTLRVTKIRTQQGELVVVPNSALRQVTNLSKDWSRAVIDVPVLVTEDLFEVTGLLKEVVAGMADDPVWSELLLGDPVVAGVETIDVGYVQLRLIARTLPGRQFEVAREIRLRASSALRAAGVASPAVGDSATKGTP